MQVIKFVLFFTVKRRQETGQLLEEKEAIGQIFLG